MSQFENDKKATLLDFVSEGLKFLSIAGILGIVFIFFAAFGCNHGSCHVPQTWEPILEFVGAR